MGFHREEKRRTTKLENDSHKRIMWETEKEALGLNCVFCACSVLLVSSGASNLQNKTIVSETESNEVVVWKPIRKFFCFFLLISWYFGKLSWNCTENTANSLPPPDPQWELTNSILWLALENSSPSPSLSLTLPHLPYLPHSVCTALHSSSPFFIFVF